MLRWCVLALLSAIPSTLEAQAIPANVAAAIKAAPTQDTVTLTAGQEYAAPPVLKVRNLTLTPGSKLIFPLQTSYVAEYYILAITNLYVQVATPGEPSPLISYVHSKHYKRISDCYPPPATGQRGDLWHPNGYPGAPGQLIDGGNAQVRKPVKVYVVVNKIITRGGNPSGARLLNADFNGMGGDDGADGCPGGAAAATA